jgi:hypothetical protein
MKMKERFVSYIAPLCIPSVLSSFLRASVVNLIVFCRGAL